MGEGIGAAIDRLTNWLGDAVFAVGMTALFIWLLGSFIGWLDRHEHDKRMRRARQVGIEMRFREFQEFKDKLGRLVPGHNYSDAMLEDLRIVDVTGRFCIDYHPKGMLRDSRNGQLVDDLQEDLRAAGVPNEDIPRLASLASYTTGYYTDKPEYPEEWVTRAGAYKATHANLVRLALAWQEYLRISERD